MVFLPFVQSLEIGSFITIEIIIAQYVPFAGSDRTYALNTLIPSRSAELIPRILRSRRRACKRISVSRQQFVDRKL